AERCVARQDTEERLSGEQAREQPHSRAAVAAIERFYSLAQAVESRAVDDNAPVRLIDVDRYAKRPHAADCRQAVGAEEEVLDFRAAVRDRAEEHGTVRDRFVARDLDRADQRAGVLKDAVHRLSAYASASPGSSTHCRSCSRSASRRWTG